ncbi:cell growth-regulating nucleolar protein isoform X2 [Cotesia typhae]|uniref:cell growth-regulating nucleolar protein isoform X2 n=1 Tax=Cotesia typhae TaxID=2053667 RepID=UPI003D697B1F
MVVFACNNCGESLQKPRVAKHYQFQCRKQISLSCVDCFKDFLDDDYIAHTKCITEAERYGGKNFVAKPSANKGERKQQEWIKIINNVLATSNLTKDETNFLKSISKHENVPRKKGKFLNFVKNAMGYRVNLNTVESCWNKIETAFKENVSVNNKDDKDIKNEEDDKNETKENIKKCKLDTVEVDDETINSVNVVNGDKFKWKDKIIEILGDRDEISLKKLRKKLLNKHLSCYKDNEEKFDKKLMKKLGKIKELKLEDDKIKRL